jgi:hypothetical protein
MRSLREAGSKIVREQLELVADGGEPLRCRLRGCGGRHGPIIGSGTARPVKADLPAVRIDAEARTE